MDHILSFIENANWAITPSALDALMTISNRGLEEPIPEGVFHGEGVDIKAILPRGGIHIEGTQSATLHDKIAVLPLVGPIFPRANMFTRWSGCVDIQTFRNDYKQLQSADNIKGIILNIDTPGGYITGLVECSDDIFETKGQKPVVSYVYGLCASGGVWIGSSTNETIMSPTAEIGSVGVVAVFRSTKEKDEKSGIKNYEIVSSQSPKKRPDVTTDAGRAQIQKVIDELAEIFIERVARNRGTDRKDVLDNYGAGDLLVAQNAVNVKFADRVGNLSGLIDEMNVKYNESTIYSITSSKGDSMELTLDILKKDHSAIYNAVLEEGKKDGFSSGVDHENTRIQAIEKIDVPGAKSVIDKLKFDKSATVESISKTILEEQSQTLKDKAALIKKDGEDTADKTKKIEDKPDDSEATTDAERKTYQENLKAGAE